MLLFGRMRCSLIAVCLAGTGVVSAQDGNETGIYPTAPTNIDARDATDLSGMWHYVVDPLKMGVVRAESRRLAVFRDVRGPETRSDLLEYNFDASPRMSIPGDWNGQDDSLTWYDGLVWFRRTVDLDTLYPGRQLLHFGAANYKAIVYVNGEKVGEHSGGFTPFAFDVTENLVVGRNSIVVGVDSEHDDRSVPSPVVDWKNYGGITRPVHLVRVPDTFVNDYFVRLDSDGRIRASVRLGGSEVASRAIQVNVPEPGIELAGTSDRSGSASFDMGIPDNLQRWSPENPKLYVVTISAAGDEVADRIGFRTVAVDGGQLLLNGERVFLRGISIHEETTGATPSRAMNEARARELLSVAKHDLNATFVRLAHYPHAAAMTRMAEEFGKRIHFVHLRNVTREPDGSFYESDHLDGDKDLIGLVSTLLEQESARRRSGSSVTEIPMRPDHGHTMGDELEHNDVDPGYSYVGRLKGLAELRGVIRTLEWQGRGG